MNCVLAILQTYGATSSLSYSLFATMADSIFDPFSNITLWITHRAAKKIDESKYPAVSLFWGTSVNSRREKQGWRPSGISYSHLL